MTVFTYHDYLAYKKILYRLPIIFQEEYTPYYALAPNEKTSDVHDKLYRDLLNNKKEFSLFLKYFLDYHIPTSHLEKYNNAFITNDFQNRRSDIYSGSIPWELSPNIQEKQFTSNVTDNKLSLNYDFVNIHDYSVNKLISFDSGIAYALATYKCKTKENLIQLFTKLSTTVMGNVRKLAMQRILFYVLDDFFEENIKNELIEKFNEKGDFNMMCGLDYVIEDIRKSMENERKKGEKYGQKRGEKYGEKKGRLEGLFEIATNMLKGGESLDKIALYTGFSKAKLSKMKQELMNSRSS